MPKKRQFNDNETLLEQAQDLMYDAFEAPTKTKAIMLAKKALLLSPDCADAYTFLADFVKTDAVILALLLAGVAAGERALDSEYYRDKEIVGRYWGHLETRPYLRAILRLGICYTEINELERAVECYRKILEFNRNDNQGARQLLMPLLIVLDKKAESEKLYSTYKEDYCSTWLYSRVLLDFRKYGASEKTRKSLEEALKINIHIANALTGNKALPKTESEFYSSGSIEEAIYYISENLQAWQHISGAIEWLTAMMPSS